jgi:hypothetical protein
VRYAAREPEGAHERAAGVRAWYGPLGHVDAGTVRPPHPSAARLGALEEPAHVD